MKTGKTVRNAILWGILSIALYLALFLNQKIVMDYFARGGIYAIAIIATALVFSFVHGTFANYFIEAIGFKPVTKK
ncbi:hypothetical protein IT084_14800 [Desulfallas sp. Bu1-1]|uniref:hypothetical protein n=1 Tax=Desulfallas sp. Bu1-1 TaxID=2787620 RepID=UPI00189EBB03|nr:hypothetical protein [Desulfallas sp. Bu1-1]MBF7084221.1 hypothetical protein [Desulfallas sp. Bu1-1]